MQYHETDLTGYRSTGDRTNERYERRVPTQDDLMELLRADDDERLRGFARKWSPFMRVPISLLPVDDEEELQAVRDTRELMLLVLNIKSLLDKGTCNREELRKIGVHVDQVSDTRCEYSVVSLPSGPGLPDWVEGRKGGLRGADDCTRLDPHFWKAPVSERSGSEIKQLGLHLPGQEELAESLEDRKEYRVLEFSEAVRPEHADDRYFASWIMDDVMQVFLESISTYVEIGIVRHAAGCNMVSFWLLVSEQFETSRVQICKACGLPLFSSAERGAKRLYCDLNCERKFRRAKQFRKLVNEEKTPKAEAGRKAHIAPSTAERILARNSLDLNSSE